MLLTTSLAKRMASFHRDRTRSGGQNPSAKRRSCRPKLEFLEERQLLSIDVVTNSNDSGPGSLRQTIASAAAGATIEFQMGEGYVNRLITLTTGELDITKNLTIEGPADGSLSISGNNASRVFDISRGVTVRSATCGSLTGWRHERLRRLPRAAGSTTRET